ncbi:MAG: UvrD-helicase domain-containing protein [Acidimicrobiia bacterium]
MTPVADPEHLLDGLDDDQARAVTTPAAPLCIVAPAGSGKTRVLTRRIAHRVATGTVDPRHVVAVTFTRKAAAELGDRLARLGVRDVVAGTFHALAYAQLRTLWTDRGRPAPALLDRKSRLLAELGEPPAGGRGDPRSALAQLAGEIEWAKARMVGPDRYAAAASGAGRSVPLDPELVADRYRAYEQAKARAGLVDFDDLLWTCATELERDARFAAAQRWRLRALFVDELQDVNPLQFRLLEAWRAGRDDVCAVGDPQQSIYGWNGADPRFIAELDRHWPGVEVVELRTSYRSSAQILDAASAVLRSSRQAVVDSVAARGPGPRVRLAGWDDDRAEAAAVAHRARLEHRPGRPWADQAVLVRTHAQTALVAEALRAAGIPHRVRGAGSFLARPDVRATLRAVRAAPSLGTALADLQARIDALDDQDEAGEGGDLAAREALALLLDLGRDHLRLDPSGRPTTFLAWLQASLPRDGEDAGHDGVVVSTFHAAKGLEWPVVHLAGIEDGYVPLAHARGPVARAEEARLLYVAMTRAGERLSITWALRRTFAGKVVERRRSPLIDPLVDGLADPPGSSRADDEGAHDLGGPSFDERIADQRRLLAAHRGRPGDHHDGGERGRAGLVAWRDAAARAARIEPAALLRDEVVERIARARPADVDELGSIEGVGRVLARRLGPAMLEALGQD